MAVDYTETGIVTKPVVLTAVAELLGVNIKDVKTLCDSDAINMWARFKPVNYDSFPVGITEETAASTDLPIMLKIMQSADFGIETPSLIGNCSNPSLLPDKLVRLSTYLDRTAWHLEQFYFYTHSAKKPCSYGGDKVYNIYWDEDALEFISEDGIISDTYNILLSDLVDNDYYVGVLIKGTLTTSTSTETVWLLQSASSPISEGVKNVTGLKFSSLSQYTDMEYWMFASKSIHTLGETYFTDSYQTLPVEDESDIHGSISIESVFGLSMDADGYMPVGGSKYFDDEPYWGVIPSGSTDDMYYFLAISGSPSSGQTLVIRFLVTNNRSVSRTMKKSAWSAIITNGLYLTSSSTGRLAIGAMYDADCNEVTEITLAAGESKEIGIQLPNYCFTCDANGNDKASEISVATADKHTATISFYYHSCNTNISQTCRIRNK